MNDVSMSENQFAAMAERSRFTEPTRENAIALISPRLEAALFRKVLLLTARTLVRQTLSQAWFRVWLVVILGGGLWLGLLALFAEGFQFLETTIPYADLVEQTVRYVFGTFFMALTIMLMISGAILLHSGLFRAPDTAFLMTQPVRFERIFLTKYAETVLLSSWAFIILSTPLLLGYAQVVKADWPFYVAMVPYLVSFVYIPAAGGAFVCLLLARFIPKLRRMLIVVTIVVAVVGLFVLFQWISRLPRNQFLNVQWLERTLDRLSITQFRLLPSWWLASGLLAMAAGNYKDGVMFFLLILANALFLQWCCVQLAGKIYQPAYLALASRLEKRAIRRQNLFDRLVLEEFRGIPLFARQLILKDIRLFRRDPVQWSQLLVFVGLLVFYFLNLRRFYYEQFYFAWVNLVSFLNVAVVALLLTTFTTRFVFPLISLEGPRFWVLGLMPISRRAILWSKLGFALVLCPLPCAVLVFLSDAMLNVEPYVFLAHQWAMFLCCLGLTGIAVGLGARFPNFRAFSAARIASGFGGTVNLVLSTFFILVILVLAALPVHIRMIAESSFLLPTVTARISLSPLVVAWLTYGPVLAGLTTLLTMVVSLYVGMRHFERLEF
ncbi:hypothetical protein THTE_3617 [Thermogutta terrifontis]|jgi:ABC-2 type transport system permease protein|uniref:ABC transporter permease protein n=1 Tax=Thermogutta terrifontis TaxID=1331910 RepID=A0A286RJT0_9BACT|nr:hypothetical protein [Thermogutta terrifontis]ASV76218.1 hypothetical protein THTE_3617 [Thermogutta terrifontis]